MGVINKSQLANMNIVYTRNTFEYFLESTAELGFENFEFYCNIPHFSAVYKSTQNIALIRSQIEKSGLRMICMTPEQAMSCFNQCASDPVSRKYSVEYYKRYMYAAAELGAPMLLTGIGSGFFDAPMEESWKRGFELADELLDIADENGIKICWEIGCPNVTPLLNGVESCKKVLKRLDRDSSGLCIDTCPVCYNNETLKDYFDAFGEKVFHIHFNDGDPDTFVAWGDGSQPIEQHLNDLANADYKGALTFEIADMAYINDPHAAVKRGLMYVSKYLPYTGKEDT